MLTWSTSRSRFAAAGGSGRRPWQRAILNQRHFGRRLLRRRRLEPGRHARRRHVARPADRRHVDASLLAVGQDEPIGWHQNRAEIDRMDEPVRPGDRRPPRTGQARRSAVPIRPPRPAPAWPPEPAPWAKGRRRPGQSRVPGRSGSVPCGPSPFHGDRPPRQPRAAAAGRSQSPPPRSAAVRCDPGQTEAARDGRARHGSVAPASATPASAALALGSGNTKSMPSNTATTWE